MKKIFNIILVIILFLNPVLAIEEENDISILGLEAEKLLNFGSGILAIILLIITFLAYKRNRSSRLIYVSIAFLLFAINSFLKSHELFINEISWIDPFSSFLNFGILLSFFIGMLRR